MVEIVRSVLNDEKRVLAVLGNNGMEKIVELKLTSDELAQLKTSADHVLENVKRLNL